MMIVAKFLLVLYRIHYEVWKIKVTVLLEGIDRDHEIVLIEEVDETDPRRVTVIEVENENETGIENANVSVTGIMLTTIGNVKETGIDQGVEKEQNVKERENVTTEIGNLKIREYNPLSLFRNVMFTVVIEVLYESVNTKELTYLY